ncbi:helix-turn-helix domain-containing protein [Spelaeicoccus albus]|nr:helix-turn-helix domain-containing protein [Spelaeicoccus albus]
MSPAHFSRCFRLVFGEPPHRYLQRRRVERSMFLLRETDRTVTAALRPARGHATSEWRKSPGIARQHVWISRCIERRRKI